MTIKSTEDILALKKMLQNQQKQIEYLKNVIDCLPGSIYWKDLDGSYLGRNSYACLKMIADGFETKYDPDAVVNKTDHDIFEKNIADQFRENDLKVIHSGQMVAVEEDSQTPTGEKIIQLSVKQPLYNSDKEVVGIVGYTIDITDKKKAEALARENEIIEQSIVHLRTLAGGLAHELKTPLAGIKVALQTMRHVLSKVIGGYQVAVDEKIIEADVSLEQLQWIENTMNEVCHRVDLGSAIISMQLQSIMNREFDKKTFQVFSICELVQEAVSTYPFSNTETELIHLNLENSFEILGEETLLKHVLWNLIKNALYFIHSEQKGEISIWLEKTGTENILYFKDTAKGVSLEMQNKIFDSFYTQRQGGTGLGLSFCKLVMDAFNGDITCRSQEGKFIQFKLSFPKV